MKNLYADAFADPSKDFAYNLLYHDFPILHTHNYWEFLIVLTGQYKHTINGKEELIFKEENNICKFKEVEKEIINEKDNIKEIKEN